MNAVLSTTNLARKISSVKKLCGKWLSYQITWLLRTYPSVCTGVPGQCLADHIPEVAISIQTALDYCTLFSFHVFTCHCENILQRAYTSSSMSTSTDSMETLL